MMESESKGKCSECESPHVLLKKPPRKAYCGACWRYRCEFQFRKRLFELGRPSKGTAGEVFKPAEQVLLVYDGSPSAVALINLALNAVTFARNYKDNANGPSPNLPFPFTFAILVILESELNGSPGVDGRQRKHLQSLLKWATSVSTKADKDKVPPFPLFASCIEMSVKEFHPPEADNYMRFSESPLVLRLIEGPTPPSAEATQTQLPESTIEALQMPFNQSLDYHLMELRRSLKSKTEDKDFIAILKRNLVCTIADHLSISKVIVPEDQTSLAVKMFSMMSVGRGGQLANEMSFTSTANNGLGPVLARPLIDFSDDDLRTYLDTLGEDSTEGLVNKGAKRKLKIDSVERQCDDFIVNLQRGYPATVSTLTRIGGKLQPTSEVTVVGGSCAFCKRQTESESNDCLSPPEVRLCYGCQHFLNDAHPDKKGLVRNLLLLKSKSMSGPSSAGS